MAVGPYINGSEPVYTLQAGTPNYPGPNAYQQLLPYALDDVCIEYSRATKVDKLLGYDAINNMIVNVLYTRIGERDFEPEFGSNVISLLFEPNDYSQINYSLVEVEVFDRVRRWVPYIDLVLSGIIIQPVPEQQLFKIAMVYNEKVTGIQRTFTAFLSRNKEVLV